MKLTNKTVHSLSLPAGKAEAIFFDDDVPGFGLRLRAAGSRTWVFRYRVGHTQRSMKLGSATSVSLATARKNASQLEAQVRLGRDPAAAKEIAKQEAEYSFAVVAERFLAARRPELRPSTMQEYERHLNKDAKSLHRLPIANVTQADIARLLNGAAGSASANRLRATLSAMFAWTLGEGVVLPHGNPAAYVNKRTEVARDRVLSAKELRTIWRGAGNDQYAQIIRLLILTGARADEVAGLRWSEVTENEISLPATRTKNRRAHTMPLSKPAKVILSEIEQNHRQHVFGRVDSGFTGWSKAKIALDEKLGDSIAPWRVHDLRRTTATGMAELGVQPHIIEACLNHVSGHKAGVAGIYNRATYDKEKRDALSLWAGHVMALVGA